jgi:uncharacterized RDD family membrane protein YckC
MNYATVWQRFCAGLIDFLIFLPLIFLQNWLESLSKDTALLLVLPTAFLYYAYVIYFHGRFGQTIGKKVMGIRVRTLRGERIGYPAAWRRSAVDLCIAAAGVVATFSALLTITDSAYYGLGWIDRESALRALEPASLSWNTMAAQIWMWSELVVMLLNKRRRALHDFIAGTVVLADVKADIASISPTA